MARQPHATPDEPSPTSASATQPKQRRKPIPQTDIPALTLEEATRVPRALADQYAMQSVTPLDAARAVGMQPGSGPFRMLLSASAAYGLTEGSAWAETISITPLGRRLVRPTVEGDDARARREAFLKPRITRDFLTAYNAAKVPREDIARNVLAEKMGVPASETKRVFEQIVSDARGLGLLTDINGVEYVQLQGAGAVAPTAATEPTAVEGDGHSGEDLLGAANGAPAAGEAAARPASVESTADDARLGRVYVTHGKNRAFVELLSKFLKFGGMEAVVSVSKETVSLPVTEKVIADMRSCGAAVIHVDAERTLIDGDGAEHIVLNENVLIEIGAAVALYGKRFILLVRQGVKLPSNLEGLSQVRYDSDKLDADAAMRLLEAIADIKNHPLP